MTNAPALENRVTAAVQLFKLEPDTAVDAMIAEWNTITYQAGNSKSKNSRLDDGVSNLIQFLAARDSFSAIQALHKHMHVHPITSRFEIVTAFGRIDGSFGSSGINTDALNVPNDRTAQSESVEREIESILITALSDVGRSEGLSGNWDSYSFVDPRICDMAGHVLAGRFPEKYIFDPNAIGAEMEAQRVRAINVWRKENGIDLLSEIQPRKVDRLAAEITEAKLAAVFSAPDDQACSAAIEDVLNLGVGALPAVLEAIETSPKAGKWNSELRALAKKLSCTVALLTISEESAPVNADLKERLDDFEGKPLSTERLVDLLLFIASDLPEGSTGIKISAHRAKPNSGIELSVFLTTEWPAYNGSQQMWNSNSSFMVNGSRDRGANSSWSLEYARKREAYFDFLKAVDTVLDSSIDQAFEIRFTMIRDE
jgi:hypothetical protein